MPQRSEMSLALHIVPILHNAPAAGLYLSLKSSPPKERPD
jgi:hypothetical protein